MRLDQAPGVWLTAAGDVLTAEPGELHAIFDVAVTSLVLVVQEVTLEQQVILVALVLMVQTVPLVLTVVGQVLAVLVVLVATAVLLRSLLTDRTPA
mgnify:CR=1 FL=1